jgi:hypothetical protein
MRHETRFVTVHTRGLTNGEGGMSSPPPSTAHVLERTSVKLAVHEQREVDLTGQWGPLTREAAMTAFAKSWRRK